MSKKPVKPVIPIKKEKISGGAVIQKAPSPSTKPTPPVKKPK